VGSIRYTTRKTGRTTLWFTGPDAQAKHEMKKIMNRLARTHQPFSYKRTARALVMETPNSTLIATWWDDGYKNDWIE
jgi:hypothetical protein